MLENSDYVSQILEETNLKKLVLIDDESSMVKVRLRPDAKKLAPRTGKYFRALAQAIESADAKNVSEGRPLTFEMDGQKFEVGMDEVLFSYDGPPHLECGLEQGTFLALDTTITPEFLQEGLARDLNRLLQDQRKTMNLKISDRIAVRLAAPPHIAKAVSTHEAFLRNELLAEKLELGGVPKDAVKLSLGGEEILVAISPLGTGEGQGEGKRD